MDLSSKEIQLEELELDLEEQEESVGDETSPSLLNYPCIVISNVTTQEEILYLLDKCKSYNEDSVNLVNAYIEFEGLHRELGKLELKLDTLLTLRHISTSYKVTYYLAENTFKGVDINDPHTLEKFI